MPGLVAFKRRWEIGSDDLLYPAFAESFLRIACLTAVSVVFSMHKDQLGKDSNCEGGYLLIAYYIGLLVILSCHLILDFFTIILATQGTIVNPGPRIYMPVLVYLKLIFLLIPELGWTIFGTYWAFEGETTSGCDQAVVWTVKIVAVLGWVVLLVLIIGMLVVFDPLGSRSSRVGPSEQDSSAAAKRMWERRCKILCCCAGCDEQSKNAFQDIAQLLSNFFQGLDLVPTDIAAGLVLLYIEHQNDRSQFVYSAVTPSPSQLALPTNAGDENQTYSNGASSNGVDNEAMESVTPDRTTPHSIQSDNGYTISETIVPTTSYPKPKDWMNIQTAAHYMKFALATYGWPMYMYMNLFTGACKLWSRCRCCRCTKLDSSQVLNDNCCNCHTAAILKITGIEAQDIIYASFHNRVYEIPFYVAMDHKNQAVVVAIRGTMSLRDALIDMTADCEDLHVDGVGQGKAHKGIFLAAKFIHSTLNNLRILENAFALVPSYRLVICGHSLGAGAASLLSILMKRQYPNLECFAFSPPGWLLSLELSHYTEEFVCSVVVGKDLVPRLGLVTGEQLKVDILVALRDCPKPKHKILMTGCWSSVFGLTDDEQQTLRSSDRRRLVDESGSSQYGAVSPEFQETLDESIRNSESARENLICLYGPGQVIFIDEEEVATSCLSTPTYTCAWARADVFRSIIVSPKMVVDHMPDVVLRALEQLAESGRQPGMRVSNAQQV